MAIKKGSTQPATPAPVPMTPAAVVEGVLVNLDPNQILAVGNPRHTLFSIDELAADILEKGGVMQPVEVEELAEAVNGHRYSLTFGFRRLAAVIKLNEQGAGLTLPAMVRPVGDATQVFKRRVAENMERENFSPIDRAVAIKQAVDLGIPKPEIKEMFAARGGRKGNVSQPLSNSAFNIYLRMLDLPKKIQDQIAEGSFGVTAAMELSNVFYEHGKEKMEEVAEKALAAHIREIEKQEKFEEQYNKQIKAVEEAAAKEKLAQEAADKAKTEAETENEKLTKAAAEAKSAMEAKQAEVHEAYKATITGSKEERDAAKEHHKALETDLSGLRKKAEESQAAVAKLEKKTVEVLEKAQEKVTKTSEHAAELRRRLEEARKAAPTQKGKAVSGGQVRQAAAEVGASVGPKPLSAVEMREVANNMALPGSMPTVRKVGIALETAFLGIWGGRDAGERALQDVLSVIFKEKAKDASKQTKERVAMIDAVLAGQMAYSKGTYTRKEK